MVHSKGDAQGTLEQARQKDPVDEESRVPGAGITD